MEPVPTWSEIVLRVLLTCVTAGIVGVNRAERGREAGIAEVDWQGR